MKTTPCYASLWQLCKCNCETYTRLVNFDFDGSHYRLLKVTVPVLPTSFFSNIKLINSFSATEPWPKDAALYQPFQIEQILLPDNCVSLSVQVSKLFSRLSLMLSIGAQQQLGFKWFISTIKQ